jgi:hypothetical protein
MSCQGYKAECACTRYEARRHGTNLNYQKREMDLFPLDTPMNVV